MGRKKRLDPESEAALAVVKENGMAEQQARENALVVVSKMAGRIEATNFFKVQADFFTLVMLKQVKESKEYRERLGMTWEEFCESIGLRRRTVDENLQDLKPFKADFLAAFRQFSDMDFSKIKYLGEAVSGGAAEIKDNAIVYKGEAIPLTPKHRDEVQAVLDQIQEDLGKRLEETEAELRAQKRVSKSKEGVIAKMEAAIKRLEKHVELEELTDEEADLCNILEAVQTDFVNGISTIKRKIPFDSAPKIVHRRLYFLLLFMQKICMEERLDLHEHFREADEAPWEITEEELPPPGVLETETPLTAKLKKGKRG